MSKFDLRLIPPMIDPKNIISITLADKLQTSGQFIRLHSLNLINVDIEEFQVFEKHIMKYPLKSCSISPGNSSKYYYNKSFDLILLSSIISHKDLRKFEFDGEVNLKNQIQWPVLCRLQHRSTIESSVDRQFCDGSRWKEFIQMKLPLLSTFQFWFLNSRDFNSNSGTVESLIASFQTPFWIENKN
ncbi:unnamed protein product, partial [Adineta steineri]